MSESLRKMASVHDAELVTLAMIKIIQYNKPIEKILKICEEENERRRKVFK